MGCNQQNPNYRKLYGTNHLDYSTRKKWGKWGITGLKRPKILINQLQCMNLSWIQIQTNCKKQMRQ